MRKHVFVACAAILAATIAAGAQNQAGPELKDGAAATVSGPWSLQDCIGYALEHNISVQQSQVTVDEKAIEYENARYKALPGVSGSASQNFSFGRGLTADNTYSNANTTSTSFSVGADVPIFQGFQIRNGVLLSQLDLQAANADLEKARDDIRVSVAQAYVQILYDMEIVQVARDQVQVDSLQVVRLKEMRRNGKASSAEVSAQESTLAQSMLSETEARGNLTLALLDLSQLLELQSPEGFSVAVPAAADLDVKLLPLPEDIYASAVKMKPAVVSDSLRLEYAAKNIEVAKGGYLPTLSANGGIGTNYYTASGADSKSFGDQLSNNFSQYVGLSLNVPIFQRFQTRNSVKSAKLSYHNQELQLANTKKSLYKEIQTAYYNAVTSQSKYLSSRKAAESAREAFDLTKAKYEAGKSNVTEYNESRTQYLSAQSNLSQARYQMVYQTKLLDFYAGSEMAF